MGKYTKSKSLKKVETTSLPKKTNKVGMYVQLVVTLIAVLLAIFSFIYQDLIVYLQILVALDMFIMAYNNQVLYKRKVFTFLYIGVGVFIFVIVFMNLLR